MTLFGMPRGGSVATGAVQHPDPDNLDAQTLTFPCPLTKIRHLANGGLYKPLIDELTSAGRDLMSLTRSADYAGPACGDQLGLNSR